MNDNSLAVDHYLHAKSDLKRDVKIFTIFTIIFSVVIFIVMTVINYNSSDRFETVWVVTLFPFLSILWGTMAACIPIGLKVAFKFAWERLYGFSLLLLIIIYAVGVGFGWVITIVKFSVGYSRIRKLGKALQNSQCI